MRVLLVAFGILLSPTMSPAGGLFGDALNVIVPGAGTKLDEAHDRIKGGNNSVYRQIEEGASGAVRQVTRETFVETTWPALASAINLSRSDALRNGVDPVPDNVKRALAITVPAHVLNHARYRIGGGGDLSLQVNSFRYGDAAAITLNEVIVFRNDNDANDLALWAHELEHVNQYMQWGVQDFAKRYIRDHNSVENQAIAASNRFVQAYTASNNQIQTAQQQFSQSSNICRVGPQPAAGCYLSVYAPLGTSCWCGTGFGPMQGFLSEY